ncbi:MAG: FAD-dependent oxidoreductase [Roseibium sp.]|uniref:NAD(P)/FAD-dependent oxidoreductase n=1 Tax=Roseibium sp. TaxID=1936156 RepID=UPI00263384A2|nr:FAD-dependent oxidoreductase [Roseibium sp.]MCV0425053.1 FAD-dependent oxidoreductase [Roseibium sp.]
MRVVIVGGGQAGASVVSKLRQLGFDGELLMISQETVPPYERPPLSKKHLQNHTAGKLVAILPEEFWTECRVELRLNTRVDAIDPEARFLQAGKERIDFDHLVLATGSSARRLPEAITNGLEQIFHLRDVEDANALHAHLQPGTSLVIVGGGYIGMELAATARVKGLEVTVIERDDRILKRVASMPLSNEIGRWHRDNGVRIIECAGVAKLSGRKAVQNVTLQDGTKIRADIVVVGVGVSPRTGLAEAAGLELHNGISVNALGLTSRPGIWAAGDCASFEFEGRVLRLENVQNAIEQAETVAENILGANKNYRPLPTFWSEQFDHLVQIAGLFHPSMTTVNRQTPSGTSFWHYHDDNLKAVEVLNDPKAFSIARRMLADGRSPAADEVASPDLNLKTLLKTSKKTEPV